MTSVKIVSYTHLDVYKRQLMQFYITVFQTSEELYIPIRPGLQAGHRQEGIFRAMELPMQIICTAPFRA